MTLYLFVEAHSSTLLENCLFLGTDSVRGQKSWLILARNGGHCLLTFGVAYNSSSANMNEWPSVVEITPIKTLGHAFRKLKDRPSKDQLKGIL